MTNDTPTLTTRSLLLVCFVVGVVFGVYRLALQFHSMHLFLLAVALLLGLQAWIMDWLRRYLQPYPSLWLLVPVLSAVLFLSQAGFAIATALRGV